MILKLCEVLNVFISCGNYRLGATPLMELMIAAGKAVAQLQLDYGLAVERVYTGSFMTSLDMKGKRSLLFGIFILWRKKVATDIEACSF